VRSKRMVEPFRHWRANGQRTRANAERCHCCHGYATIAAMSDYANMSEAELLQLMTSLQSQRLALPKPPPSYPETAAERDYDRRIQNIDDQCRWIREELARRRS
jgi:hypothetical protein